MFLIASKYLIPKGYRSMALFPFVILREKNDASDKILLNHEKIHLRQQLELLVIPFYIWYFAHYVHGLFKYRKARTAYRKIVFEVEAYANENDFEYLKKRSLWGFAKYL